MPGLNTDHSPLVREWVLHVLRFSLRYGSSYSITANEMMEFQYQVSYKEYVDTQKLVQGLYEQG